MTLITVLYFFPKEIALKINAFLLCSYQSKTDPVTWPCKCPIAENQTHLIKIKDVIGSHTCSLLSENLR